MSLSAGSLVLDAEALYKELLRGVRSLMGPNTQLAGVASGGAWLAERLHKDLGLPGKPGVLSSALHRDDFAQRGMSQSVQTQIDFDVNGVRLAVLVDRGGRELPVAAEFAAARVALPASQQLALARTEDGTFQFEVKEA